MLKNLWNASAAALAIVAGVAVVGNANTSAAEKGIPKNQTVGVVAEVGSPNQSAPKQVIGTVNQEAATAVVNQKAAVPNANAPDNPIVAVTREDQSLVTGGHQEVAANASHGNANIATTSAKNVEVNTTANAPNQAGSHVNTTGVQNPNRGAAVINVRLLN